MNTSYPPPVDKLLTYGDCRKFREWPDYLALGFTHEHVDDLIRMATSEELNWGDSDSLAVWAPVHAWRVLGQLRAAAAIAPLINFLKYVEPDDQWAPLELPQILGMIGPAAIPVLAEFLLNPTNGLYPRTYAGDSLCEIGKWHPEFREACVKHLAAAIKQAENNHPSLNGFILANLLDLKAVEAAPEIKRAFDAEAIDPSIAGDWEDVQIEFGLLEARKTRPTYSVFDSISEDDDWDEDEEMTGGEESQNEVIAPLFHNNRKKRDAAKAKNKKAMAKKSRRQNRKKKKKK
ncbi:PBS lyase [candidate division KSB1 bacterium]|nr:PBS lyase [candidate division KSB1 bacterium]